MMYLAMLATSASADDRSWTPEDSIAIRYFVSQQARAASWLPTQGSPIVWSPDHSAFFYVTRHGSLDCDCNIYELRSFQVADVARALETRRSIGDILYRGPSVSATMRSANSSTYYAGISEAHWASNTSILFIGVEGSGRRRIYRLDVTSGHLQALSEAAHDVSGYTIVGDSILYQSGTYRPEHAVAQYPSMTVEVMEWDLLLSGTRQTGIQLYSAFEGRPPRLVDEYMSAACGPWISPDGRFAVMAYMSDHQPIPPEWSQYGQNISARRNQLQMLVRRFMLVDLRTGRAEPMIDAPTGQVATFWPSCKVGALWFANSEHVILIRAHVPSLTSPKQEASQLPNPASIPATWLVDYDVRTKQWVRIDQLPTETRAIDTEWFFEPQWVQGDREFTISYSTTADDQRIAAFSYRFQDGEWQRSIVAAPNASQSPEQVHKISVSVREDMNAPSVAIASDGENEVQLTAPDPALERLRRSRVQEVTWIEPGGRNARGGLLLPADYTSGRLPLVIQAYHYMPNLFRPDGPYPVGYAAQALAAHGFAVLSIDIPMMDSQLAQRLSETPQEEGSLFVARIDAAVEFLEAQGVVDRNRVGLVGFSRGGYMTLYALSHPGKVTLAAAIDADGWTGSYFEYVVDSAVGVRGIAGVTSAGAEYERQNGGRSFWQDPESWIAHSPAFNIGRAKTPTLLMTGGTSNVMLSLEVIAAFKVNGVPFEYLLFPEGSHQLQRPFERKSSMSATLDWMDFWLQDRENIGVDSIDQYRRWSAARTKWRNALTTEHPGH